MEFTVSVGNAALASGGNEASLLELTGRATKAAGSKGGKTCAVANA